MCLIVTATDSKSIFSIGLLRAFPKWLGKPNRDDKHSISMEGRKAIDWICTDHPMPENFLLNLDPETRTEILSLPSGQKRVLEVFRRMIGKPISTNALDTLAVQRDPSKRIRDARKALKSEGIGVFSHKYGKKELALLDFPPLNPDYWVSLRISTE